jgi:hypothetical protein
MRGLTHGDFNGDGREDIAVGGTTVGVFFNTGNGTFAPAVNYSLGAGEAVSIKAGDLDKDGHVDLAAANYFGEEIELLHNQGDGTFARTTLSGGASTIDVADMNGDGWLDLVAGASGNTMSVWLNDGTGAFTSAVNSTVGGEPVLADFNGDGNPDVATAVGASGVRVYFNDGSGHLGSRVDYAQPLVLGLTAADMNGDGKADLVTTSQVDTVDIRLNQGNGTFGAAQSFFMPGAVASHLQTADFNGDGAMDVAAETIANDRNGVGVLLNEDSLGRVTGVTMMQSSSFTGPLQAVTFTAHVWPSGGGTVTGRVRFVVDGVTWAAAPVRNGVAQFQTSAMSVTTWPPNLRHHTVVAVYDGDATFAGSSSQHVEHVVSGRTLPSLHQPAGWVDALNVQVVKGWAVDLDSPRGTVEVMVQVDGRYVGSAVASEPRPDLLRRYGSAGHGFTFTMPTLLPGRHVVKAFAVDAQSGQLRLLLTKTVAV